MIVVGACLLTSASVNAQAPVPPPIEQLTANCAASTYATDQLVCADKELRTQDAMMRRSLGRVDPVLIRGRPPLLESQSDWFKRRSRCAFERSGRLCTLAAYAERARVISAANAVPGRDVATMACREQFLRRGIGWFTANAFVIRDEDRLAAVALPDTRGPWRPYASWVRYGAGIVVRGPDGRRAICSPPPTVPR